MTPNQTVDWEKRYRYIFAEENSIELQIGFIKGLRQDILNQVIEEVNDLGTFYGVKYLNDNLKGGWINKADVLSILEKAKEET